MDQTMTTGSDIIIDFFAGSGTTGHAVMAENAADGWTVGATSPRSIA